MEALCIVRLTVPSMHECICRRGCLVSVRN